MSAQGGDERLSKCSEPDTNPSQRSLFTATQEQDLNARSSPLVKPDRSSFTQHCCTEVCDGHVIHSIKKPKRHLSIRKALTYREGQSANCSHHETDNAMAMIAWFIADPLSAAMDANCANLRLFTLVWNRPQNPRSLFTWNMLEIPPKTQTTDARCVSTVEPGN